MTERTIIHLWGKGMEIYLGNIMMSKRLLSISEDELREIVNSHPCKNKVAYVTFDTEKYIEL